MARTDPTDTGGLFIGRHPRAAPTPRRAGGRRDGVLAGTVLVLETLLCLALWCAQPIAWLWVGSQVDYRTGMVTLGIASAFAGMLASLIVTLTVAVRLDDAWRALRRAAGHQQPTGVLERIFVASAVVAALAFAVWLLVIQGPGSSLSAR